MILPSDNSIKLHCERGTFVMKLAVDKDHSSTLYMDYASYGWIQIGNSVLPIWDENIQEEEKKLNKKRPLPVSKCSCKTGCSIDGPGCKNCCKACRACSTKCTCKGLCNNPHNNDGDCVKCRVDAANDNILLEEADSESIEELASIAFADQTVYFDPDSDIFVNIPSKANCDDTANIDSDTDTVSVASVSDDSDTYMTDESDMEPSELSQ